MTTEIAIINRQGVALAADSAVTVGKERVWKTANKLFSLGPSHDIGIMMHGSAEFLGYPWETIIKVFRKEAQGKSYKTVNECAEDLVRFIKSNKFRNDTLEMVSFAGQFIDVMTGIKSYLNYNSKIEFRQQIIGCCKAWLEAYTGDEGDRVHDEELSISSFSHAWRTSIKRLAGDVFGEVITKAVLDSLVSVMFEYTRREVESDYYTGVVVAGFGSEESMPAIVTYHFDGRHKGVTRCWRSRSRDLNESKAPPAAIIPFGQSDVIYMLMEGVSESCNRFVNTFFEKVIEEKSSYISRSFFKDKDEAAVESSILRSMDRKILESFKSEFARYRKAVYVDPIVSVIRSLPKEEMASMAESLIDITSLRRRVDSPLESVGGPVDVAVISKGDGFVWMKRKHYFDLELNRDFLYRKHGLGA